VNPWGIVFTPNHDVWVADNGTSVSTIYDGLGVLKLPTVTIPVGASGDAAPTGIVANATADFVVGSGGNSAPATFIFSSEGGTISAWNLTVSLSSAITVYDDGNGGAIYKGLALANNGTANFLYATDFHNGKVDVFDASFAKVAAAGGFTDPTLPAGYAPFGIQNVDGKLIVTYAEQKGPDNVDEVDGAGLGLVDEFDADGNLLAHVAGVGGSLNAPWGVALAPADFGPLSNTLLIGNFGDGTIVAYNPSDGSFVGTMNHTDGTPVQIPGLWGIAFGNDFDNQPANSLFFAAGINDEADGLYGRIDVTTSGGTTGGMGGGY
jgi:uncharacterized protein (TIGR03118 family)